MAFIFLPDGEYFGGFTSKHIGLAVLGFGREDELLLDIARALKLKKSGDLLEAAKEAEHSNCEQEVIRELYRLYFEAAEKEERRRNPWPK